LASLTNVAPLQVIAVLRISETFNETLRNSLVQ
jgi:hypothetical protein